MNRKSYPREFKIKAVKLVLEQGLSITKASKDLGINPNMLSRWKKQFLQNTDGAFPGNGRAQSPEVSALEKELLQLKKENARLRKERDVFKQAAAFFAMEQQNKRE